jgi:hypothetical protein
MSSQSTDCSSNAIALLKADHHELLKRFERFLALSTPYERQEVWQMLSEALKRHMAVEAEVFFPWFLDATEDALTHFVASVGHENMTAEMRDISEESNASAHFVSRVRTLKKAFVHHIADMEGAGGMFEMACRSGINHEALTRLLRAHFAARGAAAESPPPIDRRQGES